MSTAAANAAHRLLADVGPFARAIGRLALPDRREPLLELELRRFQIRLATLELTIHDPRRLADHLRLQTLAQRRDVAAANALRVLAQPGLRGRDDRQRLALGVSGGPEASARRTVPVGDSTTATCPASQAVQM